MIVNRRKFVAKQGAMDDLVAMMKAEAERINLTIPFRLYTPSIAPFGLVAAEYEFESLEDYDKFWTDWFARPETAEFMEKWAKLTESGGRHKGFIAAPKVTSDPEAAQGFTFGAFVCPRKGGFMSL